ncbi:MAG: exodeoxyribonuclease III [Pseudomonadota bacterium]
MKLISWNVNGVRAIVKKDFEDQVNQFKADIIIIQETKAQDDQVLAALANIDSYHIYSNSAQRKGYSGTAILSKEKPINVSSDIGISKHDQEGRVLLAEYKNFFLVNVYVPNSGNELLRLDYRKTWDKAFLKYLKKLETKKPVIVGGDFNVAHQDIDLTHSKANYNKNAGYTQTEIDGMDNYVNSGFIDTFRHIHPDKVKYSWWSYRAGARANNVGWRIDYFLASSTLKSKLKDADCLNKYMGSDHCPIMLEIE